MGLLSPITWRVALTIASLEFIAACSAPSSNLASSSGTSNAPDATISIVRDAKDDTWEVTYKFANPVRKAFFVVDASQMREKRFEVLTPGAIFKTERGHEVIEFQGEPKTELLLKHKTISDGFDHGHEFHIPFTNGDVLVYSGYYSIYKTEDADNQERGVDHLRYNFEMRGSGHVIHKGTSSTSPIIWDSSENEWETFVFFGQLTAKTYANGLFSAVLDPNLPAWLRDRFEDRMPALFASYTQRLFPLGFTPTLFLAAGLPAGSRETGRMLKGAQATAMGINKDEYAAEDPFLDFVFTSALLAHENIHLWNAHSVDMDAAWQWEGGADTLAQIGLLNDGYIKQDCFNWYLKNALDQCIDGLKAAYAAGIGHQDTSYQEIGVFPYRCGYVLGYLTSKALDKNRASNIFAFWSELMKDSLATRSEISNAKYVESIDRFTLPRSVKLAIRAWTTESLTEGSASGEVLFKAFDELGETWHRNQQQPARCE